MKFLVKIILFQLLISLVVLPLPAAGNLEYEYALFVSIIVIVSSSIAAFALPSKWWGLLHLDDWRIYVGVLLSAFSTLIPGSVLFSVSQCPCSANGFYFWMILLVIPAVWIGLGVVQLAAVFHDRGQFRYQRLAALLPVLGILVSLLWLWFFPQKRITSMMLGFIHGPIYDRQIEVDAGIILMRLAHALIGILMIAIAGGLLSLREKRVKILIIGTVSLMVWAMMYPSQSHGLSALERGLPNIIREANIELYYGALKGESDEEVKILAKDASFHVSEIKQLLGINLIKPIKIFVYSSGRQKKLLFGGGQTDVTDVWTPSVHIDFEESPHSTLRHELVHAVASYASWHSIGFHPNMIVTEGLAMALAPVDYSISLDQMSAGLIKSGRIGNVGSLFNPLGFWSEAGSRSYAVAGSMFRWLSSQFGAQSVRAIYRGQDIEQATGKSRESLIEDWKKFVEQRYSTDTDILVESISREPSVLGDICPHSVADLSRKRSDGLLVRLRQPVGWDPELWTDWRARLDPDDRSARLDSLRRSLKIFFDASDDLAPNGISVWVETIGKSRNLPPRVVEDIEAEIIHNDLRVIAGDIEPANRELADLYALLKGKSIGESLLRQISVRLALASAEMPGELPSWRRYLAGWGHVPPLSDKGVWAEVYLRARRDSSPGRTILDLWETRIAESVPYPEIAREWQKMIARGWVRIGDFERAAKAYEKLIDLSSGDSKLLAEEHLRRARFLQASKQTP